MLQDPRQYPAEGVTNMLIQLAGQVLRAADAPARAAATAQLSGAMTDYLQRDELLALSVALAMAPSQAAYKVLWQALRDSVEQVDGRHAVVFAVPVVLVAGSRQQAELPGRVADVDGLNALFAEHGVFAPGAEVFLSGKLVSPETLVGITPAQLYRFTRQLADAARGLPIDLPEAPVVFKEEGVFLRYLVGVAMADAGQTPVRLGGAVGSWGMPLMKFLGQSLGSEGVTLFPVARPPQTLMQALVTGQESRLELAQQVFASTAIRRLRDADAEPVAVISAHEGGELRFTLSAGTGEGPREGFVWPLSPLDSSTLVVERFVALMTECHVRDVRLAPGLQPDLADGRPLFLFAGDVPPADALLQ